MKNYLYFTLLIILTSCMNLKNENERRLLKNYSNGLTEFGNDLVDHFPHEIKEEPQLIINYPAGSYAIGMAGMIFSHHLDSIEFNSILRKLRLNRIVSHVPNDSVFIIIGDTIDYSDKIYGIPIPSFESYERDFGLNDKYLTHNHKIYVLEVKSGEYMEKEFLTSSNNLPVKWQNGFSRGIATNEKEKEVIYWLCVW